jgi:hypothetical protein
MDCSTLLMNSAPGDINCISDGLRRALASINICQGLELVGIRHKAGLKPKMPRCIPAAVDSSASVLAESSSFCPAAPGIKSSQTPALRLFPSCLYCSRCTYLGEHSHLDYHFHPQAHRSFEKHGGLRRPSELRCRFNLEPSVGSSKGYYSRSPKSQGKLSFTHNLRGTKEHPLYLQLFHPAAAC